MNSIEVMDSPLIKDENYAKTASLLKVIAAQNGDNHETSAAKTGILVDIDDSSDRSFLSDINANDQMDQHLGSGRAAYIPYMEVRPNIFMFFIFLENDV